MYNKTIKVTIIVFNYSTQKM